MTRTLAVFAERSPTRRVGWTAKVTWFLTHLWIVLLPIQLPLFDDGGRPLNLAPSDLVLALALVTGFSSLTLKPRVWSVWHFALPGMLILNLMAVGVFNRYTILNKVVGVLVLLAAYLLLTSMANTIGDVRKLISTFVIGTAVVNLIALVSHVTGYVVPVVGCEAGCLRFQGFLPDPNLYSSVLVVAWALMWGHTGRGERFISAPVDWLLHASLLFGLVLTVSRSGWIALAVAIIVGLVLKGGISMRGWAGLLVVAALGVFVVGSQFAAVGDLAGRTNTIDSRWVLIDQGLAAFGSNPILGIGLGNFVEQYGQIIHNSPLWIAAEFGVIGVVVLSGLLFWFVDRGIAIYRFGGASLRGIAIGLLLGNLAMFAFSLSVEALYQRHWWFLLAMTAVVHGSMERPVQPHRLRVGLSRSG